MDTPIVVPALAAIAALLGVALTSFVQFRNQRSNQDFQLRSDAIKHERDRTSKEAEAAVQRLTAAHKLLSKIAREFSITSLDILWRSKMTDGEYDKRYLSACLDMDELRAFAGLYEAHVAEDLEELNSQMNIFWGNFKLVLRQSALGEKVDRMTPCLICAHDAATKIGRITASTKARLGHRVAELGNGG